MKYMNEKKFKNITLTKDNFYVLIDFDQTLTSINSPNSFSAIINSSYVNDEHREQYIALYNFYKPIEIDTSLDFETRKSAMMEWYSKNMSLLKKYFPVAMLPLAVKNSNLEFRVGAIDFLRSLHENHIPVIILSAGLGNTIEEFLKLQNCYYDNIFVISNFFTDNHMHPFEYVSAINKNSAVLPTHITKQISNKPYTLLLGDVVEDIGMVDKKQLPSTITIGFLDKNINEKLEFYKSNFDIVLTDNTSFYEVQNIINSLAKNQN